MTTYSVYCYNSGDRLDGTPSLELIEASLDPTCAGGGPAGAVHATPANCAWDYVRADDVRPGDDVRVVYVMED